MTDIIASIVWPGEPPATTKVWRRRVDGALAHWTGPESLFDQAIEEVEVDDAGWHVGDDLIELHLAVLEEFHERMSETDRNLLVEIDELLAAVRTAS